MKRFWNKVNKTDYCWEWTARIGSHGYGEFSMNNKSVLAHRIFYEWAYKPIPKGLFVLHSCDNRRCVNPAHLSLGTAKDNAVDMVNKSRQTLGSKQPNSKLTEFDVLYMRQKHAEGRTGISLAKQFGVCKGSVSLILNGKTWKHI